MTPIQNLQSRLCAAGFDAAVFSDPINERYLSGFHFDDGLVLVTQKKAYLITDFRYAEAAVQTCSDRMEIVTPGQIGMLNFVRTALEEEGCETLLIEEEKLSVAAYERYAERLPGIKLCSGASAILTEMRMVKTEEELAAIARAQSITDAAFSHILNFIQPDRMTEIEVALELEFFMRQNGSEGVAFDTIAVSGTNSSRPHGVPRNVRLERGFLTMDFGARADGYCSDMTRTVVIGKADAELKKVYHTVLAAQTAALDAAREGIPCRELDRIARDLIDNAGYAGTFGHSLGHGVGLFIHEKPNLSSAAPVDSLLRRGNVVTFEPGIYLEGKYGCRIEDMACVKPDGTFYNFTKSPKELIEL